MPASLIPLAFVAALAPLLVVVGWRTQHYVRFVKVRGASYVDAAGNRVRR